MRRFLIVLLALLLLCGCRAQEAPTENAAQAEKDLAPEQLSGLTLLVENDQVEDPSDWNWFYWYTTSGTTPQSIDITYRNADGSTRQVTLSYDGTVYTLTEPEGTSTYKHLFYSAQPKPDQSEYDFAEFFLLADAPNITEENRWDHLLSSDVPPTRIVYTDYKTFDRAEVYGEVPERIAALIAAEEAIRGYSYWQFRSAQHTLFRVSNTEDHTLLSRYDTDGALLCEVTGGGFGLLCDLADGGFLAGEASQPFQDAEKLVRYDADGNAQWEFALDDGYYLKFLFERNGDIYAFGTTDTEADCDDLLFYRLSAAGQLRDRRAYGGSDFEWLYRVEECSEGFRIFGSTQSRDGDLPLSKDRYGAGFAATVTHTLELRDVKAYESDYVSTAGYHHDTLVYDDDPILKPQPLDVLPEHVSAMDIFDYEDGYVIVRTHGLGVWPLDMIWRSAISAYCETVITGYSADGTPLWQTVSPIHVR